MTRRLIVLGCGTSTGVPLIGCECGVCRSTEPRNNRTRSSVLIQTSLGNILIDTTPELRVQLLREKIGLAHAVLYTHYHVDHLFGLDDVRLFPSRLGGPLPLYCTGEVEAVIREAFRYAFEESPYAFTPKLRFERVGTAPFRVLSETITPVPLKHAHFHVLGFRIGNLAYCTDVSEIPASSMALLEGLDTLILDALRPQRPHASHFTLEQALAVGKQLKPKRLIFTHMSHEMDYATLNALLPAGVELAYDGLRIDF